eukprot:gene7219-8383_t
MEKKRSLGHGRKIVEKILLIADIGKLLTLCEPSTPIGPAGKGVTSFCLKKKSPDYRLCVLSKRKLSFFEYVRVFEQYKELVLPDTPISLEWCQSTIILGYRREYCVLDIDNEVHRVLFPLDKSAPRSKLIGDRNEFLLATEDFAIFIDLHGEPAQGTVHWTSPPLALAYYEPYLLALGSQRTLEIHDLAHRKLVQTIARLPHAPPFAFTAVSEGRGSGLDYIILASNNPNAIYCLHIADFDAYVQTLISRGEHEDAIRLFDIFFRREQSTSDESYDPAQERALQKARLARIYEQAGMHELYQLAFEPAYKYFAQSQIDARTLIAFHPNLLPFQTSFRSSIADNIVQLIGNNPPMVDEAIRHLLVFLEGRFPTLATPDEQKDVATVMVKLYAQTNERKKLCELLAKGHPIYLADLEEWMTSNKYISMLGYVYQYSERHRKALLLWSSLEAGTAQDAHGADGVDESIALLIIETNKELVWEFVPQLFKTHSDRAITIFLCERRDPINADEVVAFLAANCPLMMQRYLEYVVFEALDREEHHHTKLALSYIDSIVAESPEFFPPNTTRPANGANLSATRQKLLDLLEFSNCYNVGALLTRTRTSLLYEELVIMYLRIGQYEMMFEIIVWRLDDSKKAEFICESFDPQHSLSIGHIPQSPNSQSPSTQSPILSLEKKGIYDPKRTELFLCLLKTYLTKSFKGSVSAAKSAKIISEIPAYLTDFLNRFYNEMDPIKVLQLLPSNIAMNKLENYLCKAFNFSISNQRETKIVKNLQKSLNLKTRIDHMSVCSGSVVIGVDSTCPVCGKLIGDRVFAYYPDGNTVVHFKCQTLSLPIM